jgi:hypothetical protein
MRMTALRTLPKIHTNPDSFNRDAYAQLWKLTRQTLFNAGMQTLQNFLFSDFVKPGQVDVPGGFAPATVAPPVTITW